MKANKNILIMLFVLLAGLIGACKTMEPTPLSPEEQAVQIVSGNQANTLELMDTHISVKTETLLSENYARSMAVALNADIAQLISYETYNGSTQRLTYRFWKKK